MLGAEDGRGRVTVVDITQSLSGLSGPGNPAGGSSSAAQLCQSRTADLRCVWSSLCLFGHLISSVPLPQHGQLTVPSGDAPRCKWSGLSTRPESLANKLVY